MRNFVPADLVEADLAVHRIDKKQGKDGDHEPWSPPACIAAEISGGFRGRDESVDQARAFRKPSGLWRGHRRGHWWERSGSHLGLQSDAREFYPGSGGETSGEW